MRFLRTMYTVLEKEEFLEKEGRSFYMMYFPMTTPSHITAMHAAAMTNLD